MVTIINYTRRRKEDGTTFFVLEVHGGIEFIQSKTTGQYYAAAKRCFIPATFEEEVCKSLKGTMIKGSIEKLNVNLIDIPLNNLERLLFLSINMSIIQRKKMF